MIDRDYKKDVPWITRGEIDKELIKSIIKIDELEGLIQKMTKVNRRLEIACKIGHILLVIFLYILLVIFLCCFILLTKI